MTELRALQTRLEEIHSQNRALQASNQSMRNTIQLLHKQIDDKQKLDATDEVFQDMQDVQRRTEEAMQELETVRKQVTDRTLIDTHLEVRRLRQRNADYVDKLQAVHEGLIILHEKHQKLCAVANMK